MKQYTEEYIKVMNCASDVEITFDQKADLDYLKPKEFWKLRKKEENKKLQVIGWFELKTIKPDEECDKIVNILDKKEEDDCYELHLVEKESDIKKHIIGYTYIGGEKWVAITKFSILPILLLLLLLLGILAGGLFFAGHKTPVSSDEPKQTLEFEDGEDIPEPTYQEAIVETIDIPGYSDLTLDAEKPGINLTNPEGNTVYFVYRISEGENVIYETKAIEPGKMVPVDLLDDLSAGQHDITLEIMTYDVETQSTCNGTMQTISVTVNK